jgi:hypothetical protein
MGAVIVGHIECAIDVEHRQFETGRLDFQSRARRDISRAAQLDLSSRLP